MSIVLIFVMIGNKFYYEMISIVAIILKNVTKRRK